MEYSLMSMKKAWAGTREQKRRMREKVIRFVATINCLASYFDAVFLEELLGLIPNVFDKKVTRSRGISYVVQERTTTGDPLFKCTR